MALRRRENPVGFDDTAFQFWDQLSVWKPYPLPCVPILGKYGPDYMPRPPFVVVKLPEDSVTTGFPAEVHAALNAGPRAAEEKSVKESSFFILVHPAIPLEHSGREGVEPHGEVNLIVHPFSLAGLRDLDDCQFSHPKVGVFPISGVSSAGLSTDGATFGELKETMAFVHDCCLSPNNLKIRVCCNGCRASAFFSASKLGSKSISALHILPRDESLEDELRAAVAASPDIKTLRNRLPEAIGAQGAPDAAELVATLLDALMESPCASAFAAGKLVEAPPCSKGDRGGGACEL